ncbi:MAG: hypothetical protein J5I50_12610 [Chitinophagaceae bacterium]|nr:hypothetical protein [Chitinophagaceae bacterium]
MKPIYALLIMASFMLVGCSAAYRTMQTPDDVYYSPGISDDDDGYVTFSSPSDEDRYSYRNDFLEDMEIRRGIRNPLYRSSFSLGLNFGSPFYGFGNPFYSPLYSSFYSPFRPHFYSPFSYFYTPMFGSYYNPFDPFGSFGYSGYTYGSFGHSIYGYPGYYTPIYGHYYPSYNSGIGIGRLRDNGPRTSGNLIRVNPGNSNAGRTDNTGATIAPIRTMVTPTTGNTRVRGSVNNASVDRRNNNVLRKLFSPSSGSREMSGGRLDQRQSPPIFNNRSSNSRVERNTRTFERTTTTPPSSSNTRSSNGSTPIRKF